MSVRALLIDDDPVLLGMMAQAFRSAGYEVQTADNGRKGLDALAAYPADVVVTDVVMPEMEGIGTLLNIKRRAAPPKVIVISGAGRLRTGDYLSWAMHLGADAVLPKPFRMSELVTLSDRLFHPSTFEIATATARQIGA